MNEKIYIFINVSTNTLAFKEWHGKKCLRYGLVNGISSQNKSQIKVLNLVMRRLT